MFKIVRPVAKNRPERARTDRNDYLDQSGMHLNHTIIEGTNMAQILKDEGGYTTGLFGKYLNQMPTSAPGIGLGG